MQGSDNRRFAAVEQIRAYWEALRDGRQMPRRAEVNPRGIEAALGQAFILERIAPGMARFRLAGTDLNDLMGMEVRGMPLSALIAPGARETLAATLAGVFDRPARADLTLAAPRGLGRPPLAARMLLLPLLSDRDESNRALGCLAVDGTIGRTPRRFEIAEVRCTPLDPAAPERAHGPPPAVSAQNTPPTRSGDAMAQPQNGFAEPPPPGFDEDRPPPHFRPPHLRLVKS